MQPWHGLGRARARAWESRASFHTSGFCSLGARFNLYYLRGGSELSAVLLPGDLTLFSLQSFWNQACVWCRHIHADKTSLYINQINKRKNKNAKSSETAMASTVTSGGLILLCSIQSFLVSSPVWTLLEMLCVSFRRSLP